MKRILCILDSLSAGGAETFMMKLYRGMNRQENQIDFIACKPGIYDEEVKQLGGRVYYIPMRTKDFWGACREIRRIVQDNHYKTVLKLGSSPIVVTDLIAAKLGGAEKIAVRSCNAPTSISAKMKVIETILRPVMNSVANIKIAPSDLAACYTFGSAEVERGSVHFLHNAVDLKAYEFDVHKRELIRDELHISDDQVVLGHIGRFVNQKNHMFLIDLFGEYHRINQNAVLLLIGDGPLQTEVRAQVQEKQLERNVIFCGIRKDIPALLSAMDVFLLPSLYEGMPNTVIEAQASGLSCVISDTITRESNITGNVIFCSLQDNYRVWIDAISTALKKKKRSTLEAMKKAGYDIEQSVSDFVRILY